MWMYIVVISLVSYTSTVQLRHRLNYEQTFLNSTSFYIVTTDTVQIRFYIRLH